MLSPPEAPPCKGAGGPKAAQLEKNSKQEAGSLWPRGVFYKLLVARSRPTQTLPVVGADTPAWGPS